MCFICTYWNLYAADSRHVNYYYQAPVKKRKPPMQRNLPDSSAVSGPSVPDVSSFVEVLTSSAANSMVCESGTSSETTSVVNQVLSQLYSLE